MSGQKLGVGENMYDGDMQEIYKVSTFRVKVREGAFLSGKVKDIQLYVRPQFFLF
ncbi:hypothetical protein [Bacteroides sp. 519]|uniref:hypothetical protein n=1 Tax=Bacteroides sp. 519 TaxID=2302937 RepID=UPI0013D6AD6A|nr:hypothetical protein [Bacteroides sp. 519]